LENEELAQDESNEDDDFNGGNYFDEWVLLVVCLASSVKISEWIFYKSKCRNFICIACVYEQ
jgi:hypothetical protein